MYIAITHVVILPLTYQECCTLSESGREYYVQCIYGTCVVISLHKDTYLRHCVVQDGSSLFVKQFHYLGWPESGRVPESGVGLIDLIGQVQKWQRSSGDKPIVVHCR